MFINVGMHKPTIMIVFVIIITTTIMMVLFSQYILVSFFRHVKLKGRYDFKVIVTDDVAAGNIGLGGLQVNIHILMYRV